MRLFLLVTLFSLLVTVSLASPMVKLAIRDEIPPECQTCEFVATILHNVWGEQTTEDCLADFIIFMCEALHLYDNFVCKHMVTDFKEEVLYIVGELIVTPTEICGILNPVCGTPWNPEDATWLLEIPGGKPAYQPLRQPAPDAPKLRVLHLSDLHVDMEYKIGEEADCDEPQCCRPPGDGQERRDAIKRPAEKWGTVGECDSPYWLFENMMQNIADNHKDIDYVVVSGDLESHADWVYTPSSHMAMIQNVSDTIKRAMPGVKVFFGVGNHEGVPIDNFAPHFVPEKFHVDWLYNAMAEAWKDWLPEDQLPIVKYRGSFAMQLYPGLRMISLNNGLGDSNNFWLYLNQTDPDQTMSWFLDQMVQAERAGDKVHIVAHIPGGGGEALEGWSINYYNIINRFENTVVAQFFGHTHSEEFNVMYLDPNDFRSRPTSVIYSAPSMTTYSDYWPAYRIYTVDGNYPGSSFQVLDFEQWFLNLTYANALPDGVQPQWSQGYASAKAEYGLATTTYDEFNRMIDRMKTDDALLQKYVTNYYRRPVSCDEACRKDMMCSARTAHHSKTLCSDIYPDGDKPAPKRLGYWNYGSKKRSSMGKMPSRSEITDTIIKKFRNRTKKDEDTCPL